MKPLSRITAMLFAALLLASCSDNSGQSAETNTAANDDTAAVTESRWVDAIPVGTDLGGKTITIHVRGNENAMFEINTDLENGDILNDTIFRRNRDTEERLNFTFNVYEGAGWENYGQEVNTIRASVAAGDNAWQIISGWGQNITPLAMFMPNSA